MMKKFSFTNRLALLALSGAVLLSPQMAQPQTPATTTKPPQDLPPEPRIDFNIRQGRLEWGGETNPATVGNVIQHLKDRNHDLDFVLSPGVAKIVVSNLTLRSADLRGALEALAIAMEHKVQISQLGKGYIYALSLHEVPRLKMSLEAFNLSPILDSLGARDSQAVQVRIKEIVQYVEETIWNFDRQTEQKRQHPSFNFHQATGLLVVVGEPEQLEIAGKLVQALNAPIRSGVPAPATPFKKSSQTEEPPKLKKPSDAGTTTP